MRRPRILMAPPQGWSSLVAFLAMLAVVGLSIETSGPLGTGAVGRSAVAVSTLAGQVVVLILAAGLVGFVLARSSIGIVRSHVLGAAAGAAVILALSAAAAGGREVASIVADLGDTDLIGAHAAELRDVLRQGLELLLRSFAEDAATRAVTLDDRTRDTLLVMILGAIVWTTGQFGASSIYRFDRGLPAAMAAGVLLVFVLAVTSSDAVITSLALFALAAMVLLVRIQLRHQLAAWSRRHIADTGEVSRLFLRSGFIFVTLAVVGASTLTVATEQRVFDPSFDEIRLDLPRFELPAIFAELFPGEPGGGGQGAGDLDEVPDGESWTPAKGTAFRVVSGDTLGNYWWLGAYDRFDGHGYVRSDATRLGADFGELESHPLDVGFAHVPITMGVQLRDEAGEGLARRYVVAPSEATNVDQTVVVNTIGAVGSRGSTEYAPRPATGTPVRIESMALDYRPDGSGPTLDELRDAASIYPEHIVPRYLGPDNEPLAEVGIEFAERLLETALADGRATPFDLANDLEATFRGYTYQTDLSEDCAGRTQADCVLTERIGFCTYYATTMTQILQYLGIPSRLVLGYLPGDGVTVGNEALHAWTEVYFPGIGWYRFDPTPPAVGFGSVDHDPPRGTDPPPTEEPDDIDDPGPDVTEPPFDESPTEFPEETEEPRPTGLFGRIVDTFGDAGGLGLLVLAAFAFLLFAIGYDRLRHLRKPDARLAYAGIVALATRFGHGPRASQTELEYAATLSERIPSAKDELYVVVHASVESSYSEDDATSTPIRQLRRAYARVRTALLRRRLRRTR